MPNDDSFPADRPALTKLLFPAGVPLLWSPTLVFYDETGGIDRDRQLAHLAFMAPHVRGILVPGSTGDAWEMDDAEALTVLEVVIPFVVQEGLDLLVGVLRPTAAATRALLDKVLDHLCRRARTQSVVEAFVAAHVRGITIAAPSSATPLPQEAIGAALEPVFGLGLPTALYQLPQVTGNTMTPELVAGLAERFPNLLLFKDSGGRDEVALSGRMPAEVTLLRGAEGDYARWSKARGGPYGGFLLSSANAFPAQLATRARGPQAWAHRRGRTMLGGGLCSGRRCLCRGGRDAGGERLHQREQGSCPRHGLRPRRAQGTPAQALCRHASAAGGSGDGGGIP